ncbi:aromatic ring-hydroxylating dioxygenase subunit alpha [Sphingobium aquiterrae]|uniref:aromatic ring-hydroxylating dioxygenase subunit alpha n=1 Tax=Sphingobium aquiterrae TaxID=2038656 RepID=UPI003019A98D
MSFVRNCWYVAARAEEVTAEAPVARTLLGSPVVLFRLPDGTATALLDVCPHRAVPLSMGTVCDGRIRCAYHALEFDGDGICRLNPHVPGPPEALRTRRFSVIERYGLVWFWPGDAPANEAMMPHYPQFDPGSGYEQGGSYTHVEADYLLMLDNLFDLSHAEYVHPTSVGVPGASKVAQYRVVREDGAIRLHYDIPNVPPPAVWHAAWDRSERIDQHAHMRWTGGGNVYLSLCVTPAGRPVDEGWNLPFLHLLTPETETTTHYFWTFARDFHLGQPGLTEAVEQVNRQAFEYEDKPVLEASQLRISLTGAKLRNFSQGDAASMSIRQALARQAMAEAA